MVSEGRVGMGLRAYIAAVLWCLTGSALADAAAPVTLDKVQVQATRLHGVEAFDVPASISVAGFGTGLDRANASVSEVLAQVPGAARARAAESGPGYATVDPWVWCTFDLWRARVAPVCRWRARDHARRAGPGLAFLARRR